MGILHCGAQKEISAYFALQPVVEIGVRQVFECFQSMTLVALAVAMRSFVASLARHQACSNYMGPAA